MEVRDQGGDFLGRGLDGDFALDTESIGLGGGIAEDGGDDDNDQQQGFFDHMLSKS